MKDYIIRDDAKVACWQILEGMGCSSKHNDRLVEEVDAVFDDVPGPWISVTERLPEIKHRQSMMDVIGGVEIIWHESDRVLVYMPEAGQKIDVGWLEQEYGDDPRWLTGGDYSREDVAYWMPLPAEPEEATP